MGNHANRGVSAELNGSRAAALESPPLREVSLSGTASAEIVEIFKRTHLENRPTQEIPQLTASQREGLLKLFYGGANANDIADKLAIDRTELPSLLKQARIQHALTINLSYMDSPEFHQSNAAKVILAPYEFQPQTRGPRIPAGLPAYLRSLYQNRLLTREDEQYLFRRYNFQKMRALEIRSSLDPEAPSLTLVKKMEPLIVDIERTRNILIQSNLRLAVNIAKKFMHASTDFFETVQIANGGLMKAVEFFDYTRGYKFGTYATYAIRQTLSRDQRNNLTQTSRFETVPDDYLAVKIMDKDRDDLITEDRYAQLKAIIANGMGNLEDREALVLRMRNGIDCEPLTLKEAGEKLGITKERVRQIETRAMEKLLEYIIHDRNGVNDLSWMTVDLGPDLSRPELHRECDFFKRKLAIDPVFRKLVRTLNGRPSGLPLEQLEKNLAHVAEWSESDSVAMYLEDMLEDGVLRRGARKDGTPLFALSTHQREIFKNICRLNESLPPDMQQLLRVYAADVPARNQSNTNVAKF